MDVEMCIWFQKLQSMKITRATQHNINFMRILMILLDHCVLRWMTFSISYDSGCVCMPLTYIYLLYRTSTDRHSIVFLVFLRVYIHNLFFYLHFWRGHVMFYPSLIRQLTWDYLSRSWSEHIPADGSYFTWASRTIKAHILLKFILFYFSSLRNIQNMFSLIV